MAVGDTLSVTASAKTLTGQSLTVVDSVRYALQTITDTLRVRVSSAGVVTALAPSGNNPVILNVFVFKDGVARADQSVIQITDTAIPNATLSIHPDPVTDSARVAVNSSKTIVPVIMDSSTGVAVDNPQLRLTFHDADSLKVGCYAPSFGDFGVIPSALLNVSNCGAGTGFNELRALTTGTVWVIATANVYGRSLRDSVLYTLTNPFSGSVYVTAINLTVYGGQAVTGIIYIAPGGTISFSNNFDPALAATVDYVFNDPTAATAANPPSDVGGVAGNVTLLNSYETSSRVFLTPGTYTYTATIHGSVAPFTGATVTGQIVVQ